MKNTLIHKGLPESEIRDFLSITLVQLFEIECNIKMVDTPYDPTNPFEHSIRTREAMIEKLLKEIENLKAKQSVIQLIKLKDWEEFDVSDQTRKDHLHKQWMSFIGTKEEHKALLKILKKEIE